MAADCSGVEKSPRVLPFSDEHVKAVKDYHPRCIDYVCSRGGFMRASTLDKLAVHWGKAEQRASLPVLYSEVLEPKQRRCPLASFSMVLFRTFSKKYILPKGSLIPATHLLARSDKNIVFRTPKTHTAGSKRRTTGIGCLVRHARLSMFNSPWTPIPLCASLYCRQRVPRPSRCVTQFL